MKVSLQAISLIVLLSASSAFACPHDQQRFICPGDPVVDASGNAGSVIGINVVQQEASVQYTNTYLSNSVLPISSLALGLGCIGSICVNDRAVDASGNAGKIIGLNPYNFTAAIAYDNTYLSNSLLQLGTLSFAFGCLENYCVGDPIVDKSGNTGTIAAINYHQRQIAVSYTNTYLSNAVLSIEQLALGLGCVQGNCVQDRGSDASGNVGTIIGVNFYDGTIAIAYDNTYLSDSIISPSTFMSSEYCSTYGDSDRVLPRFIAAHGDQSVRHYYFDGDFHFSVARE